MPDGLSYVESRFPTHWHGSPQFDVIVYHWGWLACLAAFALARRWPGGTESAVALSAALAFAHRHATLLHAYGDGEIRTRLRIHLWLFPSICVAACAWVLWARLISSSPEASATSARVIEVVVIIAAAWNAWHVLAQKYGILRIYSRHAAIDYPRWIDRLFVFGGIPWIALILGQEARRLVPLIGISQSFWNRIPVLVSPPLRAGAALLGMAGVACFVWRERGRTPINWPRLSMAAGTLAIFASFAVFDTFTAYFAFVTAHSIEYLAFVSIERKRGASGLRAQRIFFGGLALLLALGLFHVSTRAIARVGGPSLSTVVATWVVFQALIHFYLDGFLWRKNSARRSKAVDDSPRLPKISCSSNY